MTRFLPIVWAGLWRKPARTILTVLSIAVAFVLFGILASFGAGYSRFVEAKRLDRLFVDPRFQTALPSAYLEQIRKLEGVTLVAPMAPMPAQYQDAKNGVNFFAADARWFAARPEVNASTEQIAGLVKLRTGVIVTRQLAEKYNFKVGDKVPLLAYLAQKNGSRTWTFDVVAIIDSVPGDAIGFMVGNYDYFDQARRAENGTYGRFIVRISDPGQAAATSSAIDDLFANSSAPTRTISERANELSFARQGIDIRSFIQVVIGATLFMLLFVTGNVMKQSVRERIPEFAVLKTIGYTESTISGLVLMESLIQCGLGAALGLGLAKIGFLITANTLSTTIPVSNIPVSAIVTDQVSLPVAVLGLAAAAAVAVVSALVPALRAGRTSIVDALAGRVA